MGFITLPKKNDISIYNTLFLPIMHCHGLWDQLRLDPGTEFCLVIGVQQHLSHLRDRQEHHPVLQSMSRHNRRAECLWCEINQRVKYPVKHVLIRMEGDDIIDMRDEIIKFAVSWVCI